MYLFSSRILIVQKFLDNAIRFSKLPVGKIQTHPLAHINTQEPVPLTQPPESSNIGRCPVGSPTSDDVLRTGSTSNFRPSTSARHRPPHGFSSSTHQYSKNPTEPPSEVINVCDFLCPPSSDVHQQHIIPPSDPCVPVGHASARSVAVKWPPWCSSLLHGDTVHSTMVSLLSFSANSPCSRSAALHIHHPGCSRHARRPPRSYPLCPLHFTEGVPHHP